MSAAQQSESFSPYTRGGPRLWKIQLNGARSLIWASTLQYVAGFPKEKGNEGQTCVHGFICSMDFSFQRMDAEGGFNTTWHARHSDTCAVAKVTCLKNCPCRTFCLFFLPFHWSPHAVPDQVGPARSHLPFCCPLLATRTWLRWEAFHPSFHPLVRSFSQLLSSRLVSISPSPLRHPPGMRVCECVIRTRTLCDRLGESQSICLL